MKLTKAAATGDRLKALVALRDLIAAELDDSTSKRDTAALAQRYMDVLAQIDAVSRERRPEHSTGLSKFEERLRERESKRPAG